MNWTLAALVAVGVISGVALVVLAFYQLLIKDKACEEAVATLEDSPGVVEAEVIREYHRRKKWYPKVAIIIGLVAALALGVISFVVLA